MKEKNKVLVEKFMKNRSTSSLSLLSDEDWSFLWGKEPNLKKIAPNQLEDTLMALASLEFSNLKDVVMSHPKLLLMDAVTISENIQTLLTKYYDMEAVRQEILLFEEK